MTTARGHDLDGRWREGAKDEVIMSMTDSLRDITRRHFFKDAGFGIGSLALASLINERLFASRLGADRGCQKVGTHFAPKAKHVIYLFMAGAPSQLDLFDHKPKLQKHDGQEIPAGIIQGERFAFIKGTPRLLGSPFKFRPHGQSGNEISELLPHLARTPTTSPSSGRCRRRSSTTRRRRSS